MSKESFKTFARKYPELATSVINGKVSWQQLYELYEIYGENNDIWNDYISKKNNSNQTSLKDVFETNKDELKSYATILYEEARLIEGLGAEDPATLSKLVCELISK